MKIKTKVVNTIPGTDRAPRGIYFQFWKNLKDTPQGKFLEITAPIKKQKLISHHLYYRARKARKNISIAFKPKAMYVFWK